MFFNDFSLFSLLGEFLIVYAILSIVVFIFKKLALIGIDNPDDKFKTKKTFSIDKAQLIVVLIGLILLALRVTAVSNT